MVSEQDFGESIYPEVDFCVAYPNAHAHTSQHKGTNIFPMYFQQWYQCTFPDLEIEVDSRICTIDRKLIVCISKMPLYFGSVTFILLSSIAVLLVTSRFLLYFTVHYHAIHRSSTHQKRTCSCQLRQLFSIPKVKDV